MSQRTRALCLAAIFFIFSGVLSVDVSPLQPVLFGVASAQAQTATSLPEFSDRQLQNLQNQLRKQQKALDKQRGTLEKSFQKQINALQGELRARERELGSQERRLNAQQQRLERDAATLTRRLDRQLAAEEKSALKTVVQLEKKLSNPAWLNRILGRSANDLRAYQDELIVERQRAADAVEQLRAQHEQAVGQVQEELTQAIATLDSQRAEIERQRSGYQTTFDQKIEQLQRELATGVQDLADQGQRFGDQLAAIAIEQQVRREPPASQPVGPVCGNSLVESPETCDDGNRTVGDGCDAVCLTELVTLPFIAPTSTAASPSPTVVTQPASETIEPTSTPVITQPQLTQTESPPQPTLVVNNNGTVACSNGGAEVPFATIRRQLGILGTTVAFTPITETSFLSWATADPQDPSGDAANLLATMRSVQQNCTQGAIAYFGVDAILQTKYVTGLGWPIEFSLSFNQPLDPYDHVVDHSMIALGVQGPDANKAYTLSVLDPQGPQALNISCYPVEGKGYWCRYPQGSADANRVGVEGVPVLRQAAEQLLSATSLVYKRTCDAGAAQVPDYCQRKPVTNWLAANYPNISNQQVTDGLVTGRCSGWVDVVLRVGMLGNFSGECATNLVLNPVPGAATGVTPLTTGESVSPLSEQQLPLPGTAYPEFSSTCENVPNADQACMVWPKGCSAQSFTCCEACQYDGVSVSQCPKIGPHNYELICECPNGEKQTMFHRLDTFAKNPDCSLSIESYILKECHDGQNAALACPCAGSAVTCTGSDTISARTCTIDAFGTRFGDCAQIPGRFSSPNNERQFNLRPNEAAQSFVENGSVLGASTVGEPITLSDLRWWEKFWGWILGIFGR